jgi:CubicO group peptidase (beta-lactamase class C family)
MNPGNFFAELKRRNVWSVASILLSIDATALAEPDKLSPRHLEDAAAVVEAEMKEQGIPGVALVVMKGDEIILARGFGVEDAAREDRVTENSIFAIMSMTKQFVAAAILQLVEQGKLTLDDPVSRHLPEFTHVRTELKIRHLLTHTSGMREEFAQPELAALFDKPGTTYEEYLEAARHSPSDWPPGSRWSYGNVNYLMLGLIVERLTGQSLPDVFRDRFFNPLQLTSFRLCPPQTGDVPGEARGHVNRDGKLVPHPPENTSLFRGAGGFCGSAVDVARWMRALATNKVVSARSYREMTTPAKLSNGRRAEYGFAMDLGSHDSLRRNGHGGYGGGFSGQAAYYPDAQLTVVVMTNRFVFPEHIERKIARRLHGIPDPVRREVSFSGDERQRYVGKYDLGIHGWHAQIIDRDGRLWFELPSPPIKLPLAHLGNHEFVSADDIDGYRLSFSKEGRELRLVGMGMMTWYGLRVP